MWAFAFGAWVGVRMTLIPSLSRASRNTSSRVSVSIGGLPDLALG
jgi:hypothetical protein